jgi:YD repeat-containing protein
VGKVTGPFVAVSINGVASTQRRTSVTRYFDALRQVETFSDLNAENDAKLRSRVSADQLGRQIRSESSEDGVSYSLISDTAYEQMGRVVYTSNPHRTSTASTDGWTRSTNDDLGRVVEVATFSGATKPTATATNWNGRVTTAYFVNETTVTDQANKVRRSITDGLGRLIRVDEPDASGNLGPSSAPLQATSYVYDARGNLIQVDQGSQQRIFTYDSLSRLRTAKNPEHQMVEMSYDYDNASNLITRTNPNQTQVSFTYDGLNRVRTKTLSTGTWTYTYDSVTNGKGRMVSVTKDL